MYLHRKLKKFLIIKLVILMMVCNDTIIKFEGYYFFKIFYKLEIFRIQFSYWLLYSISDTIDPWIERIVLRINRWPGPE